MATARERVESALKAHSWTTNRSTSSSIFATKPSSSHALFAVFTRSGAIIFATYDGRRPPAPDVVGQLVTKINAS